VLACPADLEVAAPAVPVEVEVALWDAEGEVAKSWRGDIILSTTCITPLLVMILEFVTFASLK
jgi:hypothetical protein